MTHTKKRPETPSVWTEKQHKQQRKDETRQVAQWRQQAENPDATGPELVEIALAIEASPEPARTGRGYRNPWYRDPSPVTKGITAREALAAHANTPPSLLQRLILTCPAAFCRNPVAPLLLFEDPGFVANLGAKGCAALLREATTPPVLLGVLSHLPPERQGDAFAYRHHVAVAGEVTSQAEWENGLRDYWQDYCTAARKNEQEVQWYCDLAEVGLAPAWVRELPFYSPPSKTTRLAPEGREWLRFAYPPDDERTRTLWERIAPRFKNLPYHFAEGLYADATPQQLLALAEHRESYGGCIREVIICHPNADSTVLDSPNLRWALNLLLHCAHTAPLQLTQFARSGNPALRRLARRHPNAPPNLHEVSRRIILENAEKNTRNHDGGRAVRGAFMEFCLGLRDVYQTPTLREMAHDDTMGLRLLAALTLPRTRLPLPNDTARRTFRDLLIHLARDGSRLVRWAARTRLQTRLTDPDFKFIWDDAHAPVEKQ